MSNKLVLGRGGLGLGSRSANPSTVRNDSPRVKFPELVLHGEHNRNFGALAKAPRDGINVVPKEKAFDGPPASHLLAGQFAKEVLQKAGRKNSDSTNHHG